MIFAVLGFRACTLQEVCWHLFIWRNSSWHYQGRKKRVQREGNIAKYLSHINSKQWTFSKNILAILYKNQSSLFSPLPTSIRYLPERKSFSFFSIDLARSIPVSLQRASRSCSLGLKSCLLHWLTVRGVLIWLQWVWKENGWNSFLQNVTTALFTVLC